MLITWTGIGNCGWTDRPVALGLNLPKTPVWSGAIVGLCNCRRAGPTNEQAGDYGYLVIHHSALINWQSVATNSPDQLFNPKQVFNEKRSPSYEKSEESSNLASKNRTTVASRTIGTTGKTGKVYHSEPGHRITRNKRLKRQIRVCYSDAFRPCGARKAIP